MRFGISLAPKPDDLSIAEQIACEAEEKDGSDWDFRRKILGVRVLSITVRYHRLSSQDQRRL
jgi:hypothetical protein